MTELWKPIPDWEGMYEISSLGRFRSVDRVVTRVLSDGRDSSYRARGQILAPHITEFGYREVKLRGFRKRVGMTAHRAIALAFHGAPPHEGAEACHDDGNPANNTPGNVRWDSRLENMRDTVRHGRHANKNKTECPHGHEYTTANTLVDRRGSRNCRTCKRAREAIRKRSAAGV